MPEIALQLYTLRDALRTPEDIQTSFAKIKEIGYEYVQVSAVDGASGTQLRGLLDAAGLKCMATHCGPGDLQPEPLKAVMDELDALGAKHTAVAWVGQEYRSKEGYLRLAGEMAEAAAKMAERGQVLSYHNHAFECEKYDGKTGLDLLLEAFAGTPACMEYDTYWLVHGGVDPISTLERSHGKVPLLHLKDKEVVDDQPVMAEIGRGNLNWPGILWAAVEAGTEWFIVEQDTCRRDPFESVKISLDWLREQGY